MYSVNVLYSVEVDACPDFHIKVAGDLWAIGFDGDTMEVDRDELTAIRDAVNMALGVSDE